MHLTRLQELIVPTAAGYLMHSSGARSFPIIILCCTLANLCLYKPVLVYGERVRLALAKAASSGGDAEGEMQSMMATQEVSEHG